MILTRYRYAHHKDDRTFTESDWIASSYDHFIRLPDDTDVTFTLFLIDVFADHLAAGGIVAVGAEERDDTNPFWWRNWNLNRCEHPPAFRLSKQQIFFCQVCGKTEHEDTVTPDEIEMLLTREGYLVRKIRRNTGTSSKWVVLLDEESDPRLSRLGALVTTYRDVETFIATLNGKKREDRNAGTTTDSL